MRIPLSLSLSLSLSSLIFRSRNLGDDRYSFYSDLKDETANDLVSDWSRGKMAKEEYADRYGIYSVASYLLESNPKKTFPKNLVDKF